TTRASRSSCAHSHPSLLQADASLGWTGEQRATHCYRQRAVNRRPHHARHKWMVTVDVMFSIEEIHRAKEVIGGAHRAFATRRPMLMLDHDRWLVANGPASLTRAQAPVKVLTIHKETLVEKANPLDHIAAHQQARSAHR